MLLWLTDKFKDTVKMIRRQLNVLLIMENKNLSLHRLTTPRQFDIVEFFYGNFLVNQIFRKRCSTIPLRYLEKERETERKDKLKTKVNIKTFLIKIWKSFTIDQMVLSHNPSITVGSLVIFFQFSINFPSEIGVWYEIVLKWGYDL